MEQIGYLGPEISIFLDTAEVVGLMEQQVLYRIESTLQEIEHIQIFHFQFNP